MTSENPFVPVEKAPESHSPASSNVAPKPDEPQAWQPLTFGGVARFARAHLARIYLMQILFAAISGGVCIWFFATAWSPVIDPGDLAGAIFQERNPFTEGFNDHIAQL